MTRPSLQSGVARLCLVIVALASACTPNPESLAARCDAGEGPACAKAKANLQHFCELGHAAACHVLAELYAAGRGGPKDPAKAREYFDAACERGSAESCQRLTRPAGTREPPAHGKAPVAAAAPAAPAPAPAPVPAPEPAPDASAPAPAPEKPGAEVAAPAPAPKPVRRAAPAASRATLQRRCEANDESACMALGREMIKAEAAKNPAAARQLLQQMRQACADGDSDACDVIKKGMRAR